MTKASDPGYHVYAIALGSNRPLARHLPPHAILKAVLGRLKEPPFKLVAIASIIETRPIGPSRRSYANCAALVESPLPPFAMLQALQGVELSFGRRRARRWGERTLDLDIILWSGGRFARGRTLQIPHPQWHRRLFVVQPLAEIVPHWRDATLGRSVAAQLDRLTRPKPVDHFPAPL